MGCSCCSEGALNLLYSCSGSSNAGEAADLVMRRLKKNDTGKGTCLAAVGADLAGFIASARAADKNIVIDGCSAACGRKIMDQKNLEYVHFLLSDYGIEKGKTELTDKLLDEITGKITLEVKPQVNA